MSYLDLFREDLSQRDKIETPSYSVFTRVFVGPPEGYKGNTEDVESQIATKWPLGLALYDATSNPFVPRLSSCNARLVNNKNGEQCVITLRYIGYKVTTETHSYDDGSSASTNPETITLAVLNQTKLISARQSDVWRGRKSYLIPNTVSADLTKYFSCIQASTLEYLPGSTIAWSGLDRREEAAYPGWEIVTSIYEGPNWGVYQTGYAYLSMDMRLVKKKLTNGIGSDSSKIIEGTQTVTVAGRSVPVKWEPVLKDANIVESGIIYLTVHTAYASGSIDLSSITNSLYKINNSNLTNFKGFGGKGCLKLVGGGIPKYFLGKLKQSTIVPVVYVFEFNPDGHPTTCKTMRKTHTVRQEAVYSESSNPFATTPTYVKEDGTTTTTKSEAKKREVVYWYSDVDSATDVTICGEADFSDLNGMIVWHA